jgi:hypothetical protein
MQFQVGEPSSNQGPRKRQRGDSQSSEQSSSHGPNNAKLAKTQQVKE